MLSFLLKKMLRKENKFKENKTEKILLKIVNNKKW